jgi:dihydroorotate dehydrogenase
MADLRVKFCGIESPNPFWLASGPPTNTAAQVMRAFDAGWGGAQIFCLVNQLFHAEGQVLSPTLLC